MQFLNAQIEALTKRKNTLTLAKRQLSCGIFQEVEHIPTAEQTESPIHFDPIR